MDLMQLLTPRICCLQDAEHGEVINGAVSVPFTLTELAMDLTAVLTLRSTVLPAVLMRETAMEDEDLEDGTKIEICRTHTGLLSLLQTTFCRDH
jgi:hypothetical protein